MNVLKILLTSCLFCYINFAMSTTLDNFRIDGEVVGAPDGVTAYLVDIGFFYRLIGNKVIVDSCEIVEGRYKFEGKVDIPNFYSIEMPEVTETYRIFILEPGNIDIKGNAKELHLNWVKSEGNENKIYGEFLDVEKMDFSSVLSFVHKYPTSILALRALDWYIHTADTDWENKYDDADYTSVKKCFESLSDNLKNSKYGLIVAHRIDLLNPNFKINLPIFEMSDLDGNRIRTEDLKGKYLVLDFWATWCGPCIEQMPKLVAINNKYTNQLRVISVSLDTDSELCKSLSSDLGMVWSQICEGNAVRGLLPLAFDVKAVPRILVFDTELRMIYDSGSSSENIEHFLSGVFELK